LPYKKLYRERQLVAADSLPRQWYVGDALNLQWVESISAKATDAMPVDGLRGFIVRRPDSANHGLTSHFTIVIADGQDPFYERFVTIKEIMHCYFESDGGTMTDSEIVLETHMRQFFGASATSQSLHVKAEFTALWMAMGVLCPERRRVEFRRMLDANEITLDEIVEAIKAPPHVVRRLLTDQFEDELRDILN
jgi:hypothetical protein